MPTYFLPSKTERWRQLFKLCGNKSVKTSSRHADAREENSNPICFIQLLNSVFINFQTQFKYLSLQTSFIVFIAIFYIDIIIYYILLGQIEHNNLYKAIILINLSNRYWQLYKR